MSATRAPARKTISLQLAATVLRGECHNCQEQ
jgi:hypothetical protein